MKCESSFSELNYNKVKSKKLKFLIMAKSSLRLTLLKLIFFIALSKISQAEFVYTSISSSTILADSTYNIATTVETSKHPVDFEFKIVSQQNEIVASKEQTINNGESATVYMEIADLDEDIYNLTVKATSSGISSEKSIKLIYDKQRTTMFIETDKPIYKGGDMVKFRVVILDRFFKPFSDDMEIDLKIYDPLKNLIKSKESIVVPGDKGLISKTFQLANEPNLGDWMIQVKMSQSNELKEQMFTVDQYVLPKFKIDIDLSTPFVTFNDSGITIGTTVMYTFGKPVSGECSVMIQEANRHYHRHYSSNHHHWQGQGTISTRAILSNSNWEAPVPKNVSKTVPLKDGIGFAHFDLVKDLGIDSGHGQGHARVKVEVSCIDSISGNQRNESETIEVFERPYKLETVSEHWRNHKPGLPYEIVVRVSSQDNLPIHDTAEDALKVEYDDKVIFRSSIPPTGLVRFLAPTKIEPYSRIPVIIRYKDAETYAFLSNPIRSNETGYMQLKLLKIDGKNTPRENGRVGVNVHSTIPFKTLTAVLTSRRLVIHSEKVVLSQVTNNTDIFINLPANSVPQIEMIVYLTTDLGDIILDKLEIKVEPDLSQSPQISIESDSDSDSQDHVYEPGTNVSIKISGTFDGIISLKAIDQSVLLLKKDSSLDSTKILEEANKFRGYFKNRHQNWDWRLKGAFSTLQDSDLVIFTNIDEFKLYKENKNKLILEQERQRQLEEQLRQYSPQQENFLIVRPEDQCARCSSTSGSSSSSNSNSEISQSVSRSESMTPQHYLPASLPPQLPPRREIVTRERSFFPETWIWEEHEPEEGQLTIHKTVPDTITSWLISSYQISPELGIRMSSPDQIKLTAFRPFFIYLNLPYSMVKGEILALQVIVHNYMDITTKARITLENPDMFFKFVENTTITTESSMYKDVEVNASSVTSVTFPISPIKFGMMTLKVTATSPIAGDKVKRLLIVKPPGVPQIHSSAVLLNVLSEESARATIKPYFPTNRVPDADSLTISVLGDIMGSTIDNLDNLIRLPYGCGEQNMLNFVPNIVVLDYLTVARQLKKNIKRTAERYLETGYQKELTFWRTDGSFSIWGNSDTTGSTWLTAFVIKSFLSAKKYITIDTKVVDKSLKFLIGTQQKDGSFSELGFVHDKSLQGGAGSKHGLAAYILLTFVEARRSDVYLKDVSIDSIINKGLDFLIREELEGKLTEAYPLVLLSYLLHSTNHEKKAEILTKLDKLAIVDQSTNQKHWEPIVKRGRGLLEPTSTRVTSASVEMTAYALLTYLSRESNPKKRIEESLPIANWLLKQQNAQGGFQSTQDTVIGITALAKMAEALNSGTGDQDEVKVEASWGKGRTVGNWDCYIGKINRTSVQEYVLPSATKEVKFLANGKGTALAHLTWSYYMQANNNSQAFHLQIQVTSEKNGGALHLKIHTSYLLPGKSNMAIVEANAPSGFEFDYEELRTLKKSNRSIKRFEMKNKNTRVHFYFDYLSSTDVSFTLSVFQSFRVAKHSSSYVVAYDYYDTTQRTEASYDVPLDLLCDLCKDDDTCKIPTCK